MVAVGERLKRFGFNEKPRDQTFYRLIRGGRAAIHLALVPHQDDFDVTVDLAVRLDQVEDLINANNTNLNRREKTQTYTLGAEMGNLLGNAPIRWTVKVAVDVAPVADEIVAKFKVFGDDYLNRAETLEGAFTLLTATGRDGWINSPIPGARAKRIIALAVLLGYSDKLPGLIDENIRMLIETKDFSLQSFRDFVATLRPPSDGSDV